MALFAYLTQQLVISGRQRHYEIGGSSDFTGRELEVQRREWNFS